MQTPRATTSPTNWRRSVADLPELITEEMRAFLADGITARGNIRIAVVFDRALRTRLRKLLRDDAFADLVFQQAHEEVWIDDVEAVLSALIALLCGPEEDATC